MACSYLSCLNRALRHTCWHGRDRSSGKAGWCLRGTSDRVVVMDVGLTDGGDLNTSAAGGSGADVHALLAPEPDEIAVFSNHEPRVERLQSSRSFVI